jgi:hypothetical protein
MDQGTCRLRIIVLLSAMMPVLCLLPFSTYGQGRGAGAQAPPPAKAAAPIDLTGYWVAEITEDWRWRMVTPPKGDYQSIPLTPEAVKVVGAWDPEKDDAAGEQCKSYGAPALMRAPTRLNITWQDDNTLKVQSDYGMQTRLLHFGQWTASGPSTWQGDSLAGWDVPQGRGRGGPRFGSLVVTTTHLRPGYLRKNGIPYSANTTMTEYWDVVKEQNGQERILLTIMVEDPLYLQGSWTVPVHFKKEPNGAKFEPTPCSSTW